MRKWKYSLSIIQVWHYSVNNSHNHWYNTEEIIINYVVGVVGKENQVDWEKVSSMI